MFLRHFGLKNLHRLCQVEWKRELHARKGKSEGIVVSEKQKEDEVSNEESEETTEENGTSRRFIISRNSESGLVRRDEINDGCM